MQILQNQNVVRKENTMFSSQMLPTIMNFYASGAAIYIYILTLKMGFIHKYEHATNLVGMWQEYGHQPQLVNDSEISSTISKSQNLI